MDYHTDHRQVGTTAEWNRVEALDDDQTIQNYKRSISYFDLCKEYLDWAFNLDLDLDSSLDFKPELPGSAATNVVETGTTWH